MHQQILTRIAKERYYKQAYVKLATLSPISETNINENAAVKPDFAIAAITDVGPPFTKAINENTKPHTKSTRATDTGYGIRLGAFSLQIHEHTYNPELVLNLELYHDPNNLFKQTLNSFITHISDKLSEIF